MEQHHGTLLLDPSDSRPADAPSADVQAATSWPPPPIAPDPPLLDPEPPPHRRRPLASAARVLAIAGLAAGAGFAGGRLGDSSNSTTTTATTATTAAPAQTVSLDGSGMDVAAVLDAVEASVVSVDTVIQTNRGPFQGESQGPARASSSTRRRVTSSPTPTSSTERRASR